MGSEGLPTSPRTPFPEAAQVALANAQLRRNMGKATQTIRGKRAAVVAELPDWEALREAGRAIKERTLRHLDRYLLELEAAVGAPGATSTGRATPPRPTGSSRGSPPTTARARWSRSSR
jgi:L-lactate dehydrogenase complex protein LldF